ncbi:MAG: hypothetical protein CSA35_00500 [Dethiosulfovibrio peptidovorans]|nr:MAG: hypothetical protein CSA35_00500 [Dethiosulfovibrio peptidovorans]
MPLLLILALLFLVPWVGMILLAVVGVVLLVLVPFGFAAHSLFAVCARPSQLFGPLIDQSVRRNLGLEHATANVLASWGYLGVSGEADRQGFFLRGFVDSSLAYRAVTEALARLKAGQIDLAVHSRCGVTVILVNTLVSVLLLLVVVSLGDLSLWTVGLSLLAAQLLGPLASPFVQRYLTTTGEMGGLQVTGVETRRTVQRWAGISVVTDGIYVNTGYDQDVIEAGVVR